MLEPYPATLGTETLAKIIERWREQQKEEQERDEEQEAA
jgi:hypothetical protein